MGATATVDRNDLACDIRRIEQQKTDRPGDVRRLPDAAKQCVGDDGLPLREGQLSVVRPLDGARRHAVHPHPRRQFQRQRTGQTEQARLCCAIKG